MEKHYNLIKIKELTEGDQDFILSLVEVFLEEIPADVVGLKQAVLDNNFKNTYLLAHKMKPTMDLFQLDAYDALLDVKDWGQQKLALVDIKPKLERVVLAVELAVNEIKEDFKL